MRVDPNDGVCRACNGPLDIVDFDDVSMTVVCDNATCGEEYDVETDAFGDGCVTCFSNSSPSGCWEAIMRSKRRRKTASHPDLFSLLETPRQKADRIAAAGNYSTRTIRKWIRTDPFTHHACIELAEDVRLMPVSHDVTLAQIATLRTVELTLQLIGWFRRAVREEEPSASYADYLCGSIDVEWGMLAEELLAREWPEGS